MILADLNLLLVWCDDSKFSLYIANEDRWSEVENKFKPLTSLLRQFGGVDQRKTGAHRVRHDDYVLPSGRLRHQVQGGGNVKRAHFVETENA